MRPRSILAAMLATATTLLLFQAPQAMSADEQTQEPEKYALMIGINSYKKSPLSGCENDTRALKKVLIEKYGFKEDHIKDLYSQQATKKAIVSSFRTQLIDNAKRLKQEGKEGIFVFQYSGHGSRVPDKKGAQEDQGDEGDGWDESLCPIDTIPNDASNDLVDDEFNKLITELTEYTDNLTLILDCCHSGTATRAIGFTPRKMDRPELAAQVPPAKTRGGELPLSTKPIVPPSKRYVVLSGCMPDQLSLEADLGKGEAHGVMTTALLATLETSSGKDITYRDLWEKVDAGVKKLGVSSQNPQIEGDLNRVLFKGAKERTPSYFKVTNDLGDKKVEIDAGTSIGVETGGIVAFYKNDSKKLAGEEGKVTLGDVEEAFNYSAIVKLRNDPGNSLDIKSTKVVPVTPFFGKRKLSVVLEALGKKPLSNKTIWNSLNAELPKKEAFDFKVSQTNPLAQEKKDWTVAIVRGTESDYKKYAGTYKKDDPQEEGKKEGFFIATQDGSPLYDLFVPADTANGVKVITDALENRSRQEAIRSFNNDRTEIAKDIEIKIERVTSATPMPGSKAFKYTFKEEELDNLSIPTFKRGDRFRLAITNTGKNSLYVTGVCIGVDGSVQVAFPRSGQGAGKGDELVRGKTVYSNVLRVDNDSPVGFETLKLIVTSGEVDYSSLEQPKVALQVLTRGRDMTRGPSSEGVRDMLLQAMYKPQDKTRSVSEDAPGLDDWFTKRIDYRIITK